MSTVGMFTGGSIPAGGGAAIAIPHGHLKKAPGREPWVRGPRIRHPVPEGQETCSAALCRPSGARHKIQRWRRAMPTLHAVVRTAEVIAVAERLKLGCTGLAICLSGCGPLLYPEGTFRTAARHCRCYSRRRPTWRAPGRARLTGTDPSTGETSDESISVTFDRFGQPSATTTPGPRSGRAALWPAPNRANHDGLQRSLAPAPATGP